MQTKIVAVSDKYGDYCNTLAELLINHNIRVEVDQSEETVGNKIRKALHDKIPYTLVIGEKEVNSGILTIRRRGSNELTTMHQDEFIAFMEEKNQRSSVNLANC